MTMREVIFPMTFDTLFSDMLSEPVLSCDQQGIILYANPAAQQWSAEPLEGKPFSSFSQLDSSHKAQRFFEAAQQASPHEPTPPWELTLGSATDYTTALFRGYSDNGQVVIIARAESERVMDMQQEMLELTSELAQAQREAQRQNRSLQKLLQEQQQLLQTIQELTAPAVPIWDRVLLMPLVGNIDTERSQHITEQLLERASSTGAEYVILDLSGISVVDTGVAKHLIATAQALKLIGVQTVLVGVSPGIAETVVQLGIDLRGFLVQSDLQHAMAFVLRRLQRR